MLKRLFAVSVLLLVVPLGRSSGQDVKSGPQVDDPMPGSFQPLNVNGPFAGRYHCLVCEFRLNPVVAVFVKSPPEGQGVDEEVTKLLKAVDKMSAENYLDVGLQSFVVFLSPNAKSGATEGPGDPKAIIEETVNREKLVKNLTDYSKPFTRLVVTCHPGESLPAEYKLKADVTVLVYARHRVFGNFAFAEGKLKQDGIDRVLQSTEAMLERLKKGPALLKKDEKK